MVDGEETRWKSFNPEIPQRGGKIYDLEKFDATFFGVHFKQAHTLDPQCRILMEVAYEAILDAGVNPKSLRGTRTGVYVGGCISESEVSLNEYCSKDLDETGNKIHGLQSFEVFSLLFFVISVFLYRYNNFYRKHGSTKKFPLEDLVLPGNILLYFLKNQKHIFFSSQQLQSCYVSKQNFLRIGAQWAFICCRYRLQ